MQSTQTPSDKRDAVEFLGPAEVLETSPQLLVRTDDGRRVPAQTAFTFPYTPAVGDVLLVVAKADGCYAIGVLSGDAQRALVFPGDAEIRAGGSLELTGEDGVSLDAPRLVLGAETLRTFAGSLTEKAETAYRWIKDGLTVRAGSSRRIVEGEDHSRSQRSVTLAKDQVKIDGHSVHLG